MMYNKKYIKGSNKSRLYNIWRGIKKRCYNKNATRYNDYGGRGITVCDLWKNSYASFYNWARRNNYNRTLTIERIDVNGNYEPKNCKWIPMSEQASNTRKTIRLTYNGITKTIVQWAKELNIPYSKLYYRKRQGWTDLQCIEGKHAAN